MIEKSYEITNKICKILNSDSDEKINLKNINFNLAGEDLDTDLIYINSNPFVKIAGSYVIHNDMIQCQYFSKSASTVIRSLMSYILKTLNNALKR